MTSDEDMKTGDYELERDNDESIITCFFPMYKGILGSLLSKSGYI